MSLSITGIVNRPATHDLSGGADGGEGFDALLKTFHELASKSPLDRARDEVLKRHGVTEEGLSKLSEPERKAIDQEIADCVKRLLGLDKERQAQKAQLGSKLLPAQTLDVTIQASAARVTPPRD